MIPTSDDIKRFSSEMQASYEQESYLSTVSDLSWYNDNKRDDRDYFQVGRRTSFPVEVITSSPGESDSGNKPRFIISQMIRRITEGEIAYLLNQLGSFAEAEEIKSNSIDELTLEEIVDVVISMEDPDHMFIPMVDEYFDKRTKWGKIGITEYPARDEDNNADWLLHLGNKELKVHEIRPQHEIRDIFIVDSEKIDMVQKWMDDSDWPEEINPSREYEEATKNHPFQLYFGSETFKDEDDDDFKEKIEMIYRVVLSEPSFFSSNAAYRLESPDNIVLPTN